MFAWDLVDGNAVRISKSCHGAGMDREQTIPVVPDEAGLREAALAHLAKFAATASGLEQVLSRRVMRWRQRAVRAGMAEEDAEGRVMALRPAIGRIVADMMRLGAIDDAAFSRNRAQGLTRSGRSRRGVAAHLAQRGVEAEVAREALDEALGERSDEGAREAELGAALVLARKRRLGPFRRGDAEGLDAVGVNKALAVFARAGFGRDVAQRAMEMDLEEAEERVLMLKSW